MSPDDFMTPKRAAAWTVVGALAAAWFASAAGGIGQPARAPRIATRSQEVAEMDAVSFDVEAQARRLRKRLAAAPAPQPVRNPFLFAARERPQPRPSARAAPPPSPPVELAEAVETEPPLQLIGVAENGTGEALVRTAMLADGGELFLVRVGQAVGGRYTVTAISADAVELKDATTDRIRRLALR